MTEKRMLIMPAELIQKIDDNRGDMSQAGFIDFLIMSQLKKDGKDQQYVTKEEIFALEQDIKELLRSFLEFFVNYGLELGKQSPDAQYEELTSKLQGLQKSLEPENEMGKVTMKWKE